MGSWFDWGCWVSAGLLGVAALWLLWRGFLHEGRVRRGRRCPKCWYDLSASVAPTAESPVTCPECGRNVRREKDLHRTRRRTWLAVPAGAFVALSANLALVPARPDKGWTRWLPTTVLGSWVGRLDSSRLINPATGRGQAALALLDRADSQMWRWQLVRLIGQPSSQDRIEPEGLLETRAVWAAGYPARVAFRRQPQSTFRDREYRLSVEDAPDQVATSWVPRAGVFLCGNAFAHDRHAVETPTLHRGRQTLSMRVVVTESWSFKTTTGSVITLKVPVLDEVVPMSIDVKELLGDAIRMDTTPAAAALFGMRFRSEILVGRGSQPERILLCSTPVARNDGCAFHFQATLLRKGEPVWRSRSPGWTTDSIEFDDLGEFQNELWALFGPPGSGAVPDGASRDDWTVRIDGDAAAALLYSSAESCWAGTIELPFRPTVR